MSDLRVLLNSLGLGEYVDAFEAGRADAERLLELSDADLKDLGLPLGPRRNVTDASIARLPDREGSSCRARS